jgi:YesN/AraC family two-component response regulator
MPLTAICLNLTVSTALAELPAPLMAACDITHVNDFDGLRKVLDRRSPDVVLFDFDYPSRSALNEVARTKREYASVPMVLLSVQHSEALAVWTFRSKLFDYLIKPVPRQELENCLAALDEANSAKRSQISRESMRSQPIPVDVVSASQGSELSLRPAISYVEGHYHGEVRNEVVAELCGMNQFRFSRKFKQSYGLGFHEFVVRYRLREARRMLVNPASSVTQICYAAGFNDPSYFTRVFKKYFGGNPSQFLGMPLSERFDPEISANYQPVPIEI